MASKKENIKNVFEALKILAKKQNNLVSVEDIIVYCKTLKIEADVVEYSIETLLAQGDIYQPKKNVLSVLK
jgi:DNA replicative helicase MCM subunit Mcm2 (Cdc46/Mcm family)